MTVELFISDCELLALLSRQPRVGYELIRRDGVVGYSTQSARQLLYGSKSFDPTDLNVVEIEGPDVGQERLSWVANVVDSQEPARFEFVRDGRLMTSSLWPIRSLPATARGQADAVLAMATFAIDSSKLLLSGRFETANPILRGNGTRLEEPTATSEYASWGMLSGLTQREREVLVLIGEGWSQKAIAEELNITAKTIETHRMRLGKKLRVITGGELVRIAQWSGIHLQHAGLHDHEGALWMKEPFAADRVVATKSAIG